MEQHYVYIQLVNVSALLTGMEILVKCIALLGMSKINVIPRQSIQMSAFAQVIKWFVTISKVWRCFYNLINMVEKLWLAYRIRANRTPELYQTLRASDWSGLEQKSWVLSNLYGVLATSGIAFARIRYYYKNSKINVLRFYLPRLYLCTYIGIESHGCTFICSLWFIIFLLGFKPCR